MAQSLLRMLSQLSSFFPEISKKIKRHKAMISLPETNWKVTEELTAEFKDLKEYLKCCIKLSPIRTGEPLQLFTNVSIDALSFLLCQECQVNIDDEE